MTAFFVYLVIFYVLTVAGIICAARAVIRAERRFANGLVEHMADHIEKRVNAERNRIENEYVERLDNEERYNQWATERIRTLETDNARLRASVRPVLDALERSRTVDFHDPKPEHEGATPR